MIDLSWRGVICWIAGCISWAYCVTQLTSCEPPDQASQLYRNQIYMLEQQNAVLLKKVAPEPKAE